MRPNFLYLHVLVQIVEFAGEIDLGLFLNRAPVVFNVSVITLESLWIANRGQFDSFWSNINFKIQDLGNQHTDLFR